VGAFWYISEAKLGTLSGGRRWWQRASARVKVSGGLASIEAGLDPERAAALVESVRRAEQRLRKQGDIAPLSQDAAAPAAPFFEFEGRGTRRVLDETFWAAVASARTAVLLVGSARNAIGAKSAAYEDVLSPSADPIGAVTALAEGRQRDLDWNSLAYVWAALMTEATEVVQMDVLPRVRGIAVYSGRGPTATGNWPITDDMNDVVVGSPLFVEQIG
jgi:hypothetical protein